MKLPQINASFVWVILLCGFISLIAILGNLTVLGLHRHPAVPFHDVSQGQIERGRKSIEKFGCGGCHVIPGIPGALGRVGPSLREFHHQTYIAGFLPNRTNYLVEWLKNPQKISPGSAMPDLGVSQQEAEDIATYLYSISSSRISRWYHRIL